MIRTATGLLFIVLLLATGRVRAQISWPSPELEQLYRTARQNLSGGNFKAAAANYQQLIRLAPGVMELYRDMGQIYFLTGDYENADKTLGSIISSGKADEQSYQIAAASYAAQKEDKKARNVLTKGLERFPRSGLLYHELGRQYEDKDEVEAALKAWLDGIQADPGYHVNYYEAARTYMMTSDFPWAILYGEIFINMEHHTPRANETRKMVLAAYKRCYFAAGRNAAPEFGREHSAAGKRFTDAFYETLMKLAPVVADGITTENLTMLRTRFMTEWDRTYAAEYPFSLFAYHDRMLREGYFDAYNQWLFGKAEHMQQYESWNSFHPGAIKDLEGWMAVNPLRPLPEDFYNEKKLKDIFPGRKNR